MIDGCQEREERAMRRESEKRENRQNRIDPSKTPTAVRLSSSPARR
jgi:hypothetical protein